MQKYYTLILFTSAVKGVIYLESLFKYLKFIFQYVDAVVQELNIGKYFSGVYHRGFCQENYAGKMIKDLSIFGVEMSNIVLVDVNF